MTSQGSPRSISSDGRSSTANVTLAEMTAREVSHLTLSESLALTALAVQKEPRVARVTPSAGYQAAEEDENLTIEEAILAASALSALGSRAHEQALSALLGLAERLLGKEGGPG